MARRARQKDTRRFVLRTLDEEVPRTPKPPRIEWVKLTWQTCVMQGCNERAVYWQWDDTCTCPAHHRVLSPARHGGRRRIDREALLHYWAKKVRASWVQDAEEW